MTRGQHDYGTSRLVDSEWTGSPPNGEPRTRATRGTNTGLRLGRDLPPRGRAQPGPDPVTPAPVATPAQMPPATTRPLRARDHWHPSVFISEPPGPPPAGPKHLIYLGPHRASCGTNSSRAEQVPPFRGLQVSLNNRLQRVTFSFPITSQTGFAPCLQTLHDLLAPRGHLIPDFDPCSFAT